MNRTDRLLAIVLELQGGGRRTAERLARTFEVSVYTPYSTRTAGPDLDLLVRLAAAVDIPVIAEGRFWTVEQVEAAFALGAHAVVIGTAISNPREITRRFRDAVPAGHV